MEKFEDETYSFQTVFFLYLKTNNRNEQNKQKESRNCKITSNIFLR